MLNFLKSRKGLLSMVIVAILGWAGFSVSEQQVTKVFDMAFVETPQTQDKTVADTEKELDQQNTSGETPQRNIKSDFNRASHVSEKRRTHILYGDATGGGHLYGQGKPCKSEFPKHWDEKTIIKEIDLIAANDNLNWEQQRNGYYVTEQKIGTVKVRVVKARNGEDVITAYPTNVTRNPCPANDR